jgi:hypothetical protein
MEAVVHPERATRDRQAAGAEGDVPMHPVYLPFSESQLADCFTAVARDEGEVTREKHLAYYRASIRDYEGFWDGAPPRPVAALTQAKHAAQVEKDERFWIAATLMAAFHAPERQATICALLRRCLGESPPFAGVASWEDGFGPGTALYLEVSLPSPHSYQHWLRTNLTERQLIPYVRAAAKRQPRLEGPTHVDAVMIDGSTGCAILFEAKVTSDCSCQVSFDMMRNQLARTIDAMLEANPNLVPPLNARKPERSAFVLLTPRVFRDNPHARLYGRLMQEYQTSPWALHRDLPHRTFETTDWHHEVARRIGWLTFEDCAERVPGACPWLREGGR